MIDYVTPDGRHWYISLPIPEPGKRRRANKLYLWGVGYIGTFSSPYNARRFAERRSAGKQKRRAYNRAKTQERR